MNNAPPLNDPNLRHFLSHMNQSLARWTGQPLTPEKTNDTLPQTLFRLPAALVAHRTEKDPLFCFGNQTALTLFEMDWPSFTTLPSRQSAEPTNQAERATMLAEVQTTGFTNAYHGVRISRTGRHFYIKQATVWDVRDQNDQHIGQAATFHTWEYL